MVLYTSIVVIIIALTRFLAYWGINILKNERIELIKGVFNLTYVENTGAAFGIFNDSTNVLSIVGIVFFIVITFFALYKKKQSGFFVFTLALIAGGGISNVCDRIKFGFVVDYFDFALINYPVFNLADVCIVCGCILLMIDILFSKEEKKD